MTPSIAIIGATGQFGKPVTKELAKSGFSVSALVRDINKARNELPQNIQLISGNLKYRQDLENLLKGKDALYLNLNVKPEEKKNDFHTESDGLKVILEIAKKSNIKRIGFISSIVMRYQGMNNFQWWVFDLKKEAVRAIKASGIPYTIFYASNFIDNFEGVYRSGNKILLAGTSHHKMYYIAAADYARQVAQAFKLPGTDNREYVVQGPEGFTADEAAKEYIKQYTKESLTVSKAPLAVLKFLGIFVQKINYGANIIEALNNYPEKFEAERSWQELGKPTITIRDFAQRKD
jgi:uncharacterized protein YbjT (DUF2867 family)